VAAAKRAFKTWSKTPYTERADILDRIAAKIAERAPELAKLESMDCGKPVSLASAIDIPRAESNFKFFAGAIRHDETQATHMADALNYTQRCPVGVAGLITPWNLPLYLLTWKVAPCLAMGNTIVAKPSEITPMTANALAEILHEVGLPKGVFNIVHGFGANAGQALVEHPDVRLVSFTGGTVTGRRVGQTAALTFKKLSLELGGKNATVVFADCDFEKTVAGAVRAAFANQGQVCLCGSRLYVERPIFDKFVDAMVNIVKGWSIGDPNTCNFGSLTSQQHRDKVKSYVDLARKDGATIMVGGNIPDLPAPYDKGAFFEPTIITGLPADHKCVMEEIFGPVVTVQPFDSEEEVLEMVNSVNYGLAGSVWTSNLSRGHRVAQAMESGMIWVNCWLHRDLRVPFGGVKESGIGREGGVHSLEFFSNSKNICIKY
jgi:aminomuconate-semialdehyde/2-hydroxymuconate-6-semialdehyde dehydrogenase